jgi:hypothetical protein
MVKDMNRRYPKYQTGGGVPSDMRRLMGKMLESRSDTVPELVEDRVTSRIAGPLTAMHNLREERRQMMDRLENPSLEDRMKYVYEDETVDNRTLLEKLRGLIPSRIRGGISDLIENYRTHPDTLRDQERLRQILIPPHIRESLPEGFSTELGRAGMPTSDNTRPDWADSSVERLKYLNLPANIREDMPFERLNMASGGMIPRYQAGGPYQQRKVESFVSPEQAQLSAQLTGNIQNIASQPYQAYGGQRLAGTTQDQALARAAYGAYGRGTGPAGTQQAADAYTQAQSMVGGAAEGIQGLQPQYGQLAQQFSQGATGAQQLGQRAELQGQLAGAGMRGTGRESQQQAGQAAQAMRGVGQQMGAPQMQTQANLQDYMSQYGKGVTDPQLEALREFQQIQGQELGSQAATSGNLGSMRQGVQAAQQARDVSRQAADIIGGQQQKAFESAQQAFQADRSAQQQGLGQQLTAEQQAAQAQARGQQQALTAQQQGYQAAQGGTQLGLQGIQASGQMLGRQQGAVDAQGKALGQVAQMGGQMANIAGGMGTQAQREQQMQMQRLQGMEQAGARTQQEQQRDLDIGYQDFQAQRDYPQQQTQTALNMMGQLPYQNTQVVSDYQADPGFMSDAVGALGAAKDLESGEETSDQDNVVADETQAHGA